MHARVLAMGGCRRDIGRALAVLCRVFQCPRDAWRWCSAGLRMRRLQMSRSETLRVFPHFQRWRGQWFQPGCARGADVWEALGLCVLHC
eukprot:scaffold24983_cov107-Isochrysis_galbana.AAC.8